MTLSVIEPRGAAAAPVSLLQLSPDDHPHGLAGATAAIYGEVRRGRRVFAVVSSERRADLALAEACDRIGLEVAAPGGASALVHEPVVIVRGAAAAAPLSAAAAPAKPLRVALAGCGVVGGGVLERLTADPRFQLVGVLVRDPARPRRPAPDPDLLFTDAGALLAREPDVVVEVLSDAAAGLALAHAALARGVHLVTANKQAISGDWSRLRQLADGAGARLAYSAAVGGGAPMVETVRRAAAHGPIVRIEGVLNGTVNYILNALGRGAPFFDALAAAQRAGFAEEDPSADLEGRDAVAKIRLLAVEAFGAAPGQVRAERLGPLTVLPGGPVRQLSVCRVDGQGRLDASVEFRDVAGDPLFATLEGERCALRVVCEDGAEFTCRGRGAGRTPTAESVWADLLDLLPT